MFARHVCGASTSCRLMPDALGLSSIFVCFIFFIFYFLFIYLFIFSIAFFAFASCTHSFPPLSRALRVGFVSRLILGLGYIRRAPRSIISRVNACHLRDFGFWFYLFFLFREKILGGEVEYVRSSEN
jgi:hypothetical protein